MGDLCCAAAAAAVNDDGSVWGKEQLVNVGKNGFYSRKKGKLR